jgi:hypothetical protein
VVLRRVVLRPVVFFAEPLRLDVDRALLVPDVDREDVERELVDRDFAAVARPPLAPAAFFCAVLPPRLEVERDDAPVDRLRLVEPLDDDRRGDAARARETASSIGGSSATDSAPNRSGMKPVLTGSDGPVCSSRVPSSK